MPEARLRRDTGEERLKTVGIACCARTRSKASAAMRPPRKTPAAARPKATLARGVSPYRRANPRTGTATDNPFQKIAGWPSVEALFKHDPRAVERLLYDASLARAVEPFTHGMAKARKAYRQVGADELARVAGTEMHGGIVALARIRQIRPVTVEDFHALGAKRVPLLMLDGVSNPQNIGAIARTAAFFGLKQLLLSDHAGQAGLSDAAYRIAKGGLEHLEVRRVMATAETLAAIHRAYHVIGTSLASGTSIAAVLEDRRRDKRPILLVLGNEEDGLPASTIAACEATIRLPGSGAVQSLNVSVTAGVLIHGLLA